jgi:succinate-semialdehyde dehydrogenase/glutarate-semialdehyde dehydrogenase
MKLISTNPSRGFAVIGEVESSTEQEVYTVVAKAVAAQPAWSELSIIRRKQAVQSFVDIAERRAEELSHIIAEETGRPVMGARLDVAKGISCFRDYLMMAEEHLAPKVTFETSTELHRVHREPWGVIATICPWNFPMTNVAWQCGQALLAGNGVVYKNSEENPLFAKLLEEIISESSIPESVFSIVYGDGQVGEWLARADINRLSFTGSFPVGRKLTQIAAEQFIPITTELGGSNPYIVFEGVELTDDLINNIYGRRFLHSGQFCTSVKRLIVHESLFDKLLNKLAEVTANKKIGDALDETTELGPLVAKRQLEKLEAQVQDAVEKGAKVVVGAKCPDGLKGAYYEPTILTNITSAMRVWREETFGPVLPIVSFKTEAEAITLANDTEYGLSAYISTKDKEQFARVARQLHVGMIAENQIINLLAAFNPFGGYKHSGMGRENGSYGFDEVTQVKVVSELK